MGQIKNIKLYIVTDIKTETNKMASNTSDDDRLAQTQKQVDQVVDIMKNNVEKVLERDSRLSDLDTRADALQMESQQFETSARAIKRKMWWQNIKMMIIIGIVVVVIIAVIVISVVARS